MRDLLAQDIVGGQPDRVEIARLFQSRVECRDRIGGIGAEEPQDVPRGIPGDDRIEDMSRSWQLRANHRSPRYTTRISDLPVVR